MHDLWCRFLCALACAGLNVRPVCRKQLNNALVHDDLERGLAHETEKRESTSLDVTRGDSRLNLSRPAAMPYGSTHLTSGAIIGKQPSTSLSAATSTDPLNTTQTQLLAMGSTGQRPIRCDIIHDPMHNVRCVMKLMQH